ncbi:MAG: aspartate ammonia-lyase, partial [Verrucomicrobiota bacterium]
KVNPVMSEMMVQACNYVIAMGNMVAVCGRDGHFELNVTIPAIAYALHDSVNMLSNASMTFADRCVAGIQPNEERCRELVERSLMLVTALNPHIGYDNAAKVAKKAHAENKTLKEVLLEEGLMDEATMEKALDPRDMIHPKA